MADVVEFRRKNPATPLRAAAPSAAETGELPALRTIAEWPITPRGNMDAENMREVARAALAASRKEGA